MPQSYVTVVALAVGLVACVTDVQTRRIPNVLTFGAAAAAVVVHTLAGGVSGLGTSVAPRQQQHAPTLADRDYQRIVKRTRELVVLCRESGLTARELAQLVEGIWKEVDREG